MTRTTRRELLQIATGGFIATPAFSVATSGGRTTRESINPELAPHRYRPFNGPFKAVPNRDAVFVSHQLDAVELLDRGMITEAEFIQSSRAAVAARQSGRLPHQPNPHELRRYYVEARALIGLESLKKLASTGLRLITREDWVSYFRDPLTPLGK